MQRLIEDVSVHHAWSFKELNTSLMKYQHTRTNKQGHSNKTEAKCLLLPPLLSHSIELRLGTRKPYGHCPSENACEITSGPEVKTQDFMILNIQVEATLVNFIKCNTFTHQDLICGAGDMAQWSRVLVALVQDLGSFPSSHMVANNHPQLQFQGI